MLSCLGIRRSGIFGRKWFTRWIKKDKDLDEKLTHLQDKYNNLFTDTEIEFRYNGFNDENEKEKFLREFTEIQKELEKKLKNKYKVVSKILV